MKKKRYNKPQYYKITQNHNVKIGAVLAFLIIAVLVLAFYLIHMSYIRLQQIKVSPSDFIEFDVPPTPAILSDDEGYMEEDFVTEPIAFEYSNPADFDFETTINYQREDVESFERINPIRIFSDEYSVLQGITTYKGDNLRSSSSYGETRINDAQLNIDWVTKIDSTEIQGPFDGTAQPLVVMWQADMMKYVKFRSGKKDKLKLTEIIFADKSGKVYFLDIDDGMPTRTTMPTTAYTEGTPTIDPRGYPLMYIGQTIQEDGNTQKSRYIYFYVYNLITQKLVFRFGSSSVEPFSDSKWQGYGTSPLVLDDTIFIPAENGILYSFDLETEFSSNDKKISINTEPNLLKYKYENMYTGYRRDNLDEDGNRIPHDIENGTTGSISAYKNYLFFSEKSGFLQCLNTNTMELVYVVPLQASGDFTVSIDTSEDKQDEFFLYSGTRLDFATSDNDGNTTSSYFRKIDGRTGKILWENVYECQSTSEIRGGIIKSSIIGKNDLSEYVFYAVSGENSKTKLVCSRKIDGTKKWELEFSQVSKSAPIEMYDKDGKGYILFSSADGVLTLIEGATGEVLRQLTLPAGADGDPIVFGNKMIVHLQDNSLICVSVK